MKKPTKWKYLWIVQGHYGFGWEDLCCSEDRREAHANLRDYCDNETCFPHRLIQRRELREGE